MNITKDHVAGVPLLRVEGDIDHSFADVFERDIRDALGGGDRLLVDLSACPYLDSGGLSVLVSSLERLPKGGWVGVVGGARNLRRLFEIVGLGDDPRFRVFDSLDAAKHEVEAEAPLAT